MEDSLLVIEKVAVSKDFKDISRDGVQGLGGGSFVSWTLKRSDDVGFSIQEAKVVTCIGQKILTSVVLMETIARGCLDRQNVEMMLKSYVADMDGIINHLKEKCGWKLDSKVEIKSEKKGISKDSVGNVGDIVDAEALLK